ncbi:MAG TPA: DUF748 domain-containing protein [Rhizomicrobium sp.]|nr:DUF748 domain-containing protein [Rhizomicrobium sp.]
MSQSLAQETAAIPPAGGLGYRKWLLGAGTIALLFAAYILAGFYWAPGLIRSLATDWVKTNLNKSITIGEIKVDPLRFRVDISDIALPGPGHPMVALAHVRLGFSPLSLFQQAYRLTELSIDRPFVGAVIRPDGSLNLKELVPPSKGGESPAVRIDLLSVDQGRIVLSDQSRASHPEETLVPITFTLKDFHTKSSEGGEFTLEGKSERNEGFAWRGTLSMAPIASQGRFTITDLQAGTIAKFAGDRLPVGVTSGRIGIEGSYGFSYAAGAARLATTIPRLVLKDFALDGQDRLFHGGAHVDESSLAASLDFVSDARGARPLAAGLSKFQARGLTLTGSGPAQDQIIKLATAGLSTAKLDAANHHIALGALSLGGLDMPLALEKDGNLSISQWLPAQATAEGPAAPAWTIGLEDFSLSDASVHAEDRALSPAARLDLTSLSVTAQGASSDQTKPVNLKISAALNGKGHLEADGSVTMASRAADLKLSLTGLSLKPASAYLNHPVLDLRSGDLSLSGTLNASGGAHSQLRFQGDAGIDNLGLYERTSKSRLFAWRSLKLTGIDYRGGGDHPAQVDIARARLSRPVGGVAILPDRSFNFASLVPPKGAAPATPLPAGAAAPAYRLKELDIDGGSLDFSDRSIDPSFRARIDALSGSIKNIASAPEAIAAIDLKGQVIDRFSPVTISGTANLLGYDRNTDIRMAFRNIELPIFNPYSGRYAGYAIAKGKLTTEMHYKVVNRALQADHHVVIDQLEWGQPSANKPSVPWPVGLVTSLLKDRHGVIDLNLPVRGSLDDPTFRIGPIVWQIIGNLIDKIVTAPFALIGSLFEGADKAQYVDFAPGSAALPAGAADGLAALAKGLGDRPALQLDIPAAPALKEDALAIADQHIDAALMAREIKKGAPANFAALDADEQHDRLTDLYRARLGKRPAYPESLPALDVKPPPPDADKQRQMQESIWLRGELRSAFLPANAELAALGSARATAVRDALLAKGDIDPMRVFLVTGQGGSASEGHVRLELKLK